MTDIENKKNDGMGSDFADRDLSANADQEVTGIGWNDDNVFEVDDIKDKTMFFDKNKQEWVWKYLIKWKGFDEDQMTWERTENIFAPEAMEKFERIWHSKRKGRTSGLNASQVFPKRIPNALKSVANSVVKPNDPKPKSIKKCRKRLNLTNRTSAKKKRTDQDPVLTEDESNLSKSLTDEREESGWCWRCVLMTTLKIYSAIVAIVALLVGIYFYQDLLLSWLSA